MAAVLYKIRFLSGKLWLPLLIDGKRKTFTDLEDARTEMRQQKEMLHTRLHLVEVTERIVEEI